MKKLTKLTSVFGIALAMAITAARGQALNTVSVDEYGKGFYNGAVIPGVMTPDPFNGGLPGLGYLLPIPWTYTTAPLADIQLFEPSATGNQLPSDLLRFEPDPTGQRTLLFFYSYADAADPADAPADVYTAPAMPYPPFMIATETGLFGNPYSEAGPNGFVYLAGSGMPGWYPDPTGVPTQYTFISDVPEPGAISLLMGGLGLLWGFNLRRRKALS